MATIPCSKCGKLAAVVLKTSGKPYKTCSPCRAYGRERNNMYKRPYNPVKDAPRAKAWRHANIEVVRRKDRERYVKRAEYMRKKAAENHAKRVLATEEAIRLLVPAT